MILMTDYFKNKVLIKRPYLKIEWIELVLDNPVCKEIRETEKRVRFWDSIFYLY